jgi:hypothetical protein
MTNIKPQAIAAIISELYSAGDSRPILASRVLDRLSVAGVDESDFGDKDDILSDAREYRSGLCLECGTRLGNGTCEACKQDVRDRTTERDIDEARGK